MFQFKISVKDNSKLTAYANAVKKSTPVFNMLLAKITKQQIELEVARFKKSGKLLRSWEIKRQANGALIYSTAPHAEIQDEGGPLYARNARMMIIPKSSLARNMIHARVRGLFFSAGAVFKKHKFATEFLAARRKSVNLPGHHYVIKAIEKAERKAVREIENALDAIDKRTGG
jgi:hypothetical protein